MRLFSRGITTTKKKKQQDKKDIIRILLSGAVISKIESLRI